MVTSLLAIAQTRPSAPLALGPSTSVGAFVVPDDRVSGVSVTPLLTVNDPAKTATNGYRMVGNPDGLGAFRSPTGDVTVTMNQEISSTLGIPRAHGQRGSFVTKLTVDPVTLEVKAGADLISSVGYWNYETQTHGPIAGTVPGTGAYLGEQMRATCSASLAGATQLFNPSTGRGYAGRMFFSGEEIRPESRLFVTDVATGEARQMPRFGLFARENTLLATTGNDATFAIGTTDDTPGYLTAYLGTKTSSGTPWDKAGLTNGRRYALRVERPSSGTFATDFLFRRDTARGMPVRASWTDVEWNQSGAAQRDEAASEGALAFVRIEDGEFDPVNPRDFYFVTTERPVLADQTSTDQWGGLWRLRLDDVGNPLSGGTLTLLLDGNDPGTVSNPDNVAVDHAGHIILQEDPGGTARLGGIFAYRIADGKLARIAGADPTVFLNPLLQAEETSGVIDTADLFGPGTFLFDVQAHNTVGLPPGTGPGTVEELVANGQLDLLTVDWDRVFPTETQQFVPTAPARLLDTRTESSVGYSGVKPGQGSTVAVAVLGRGGVPSTGVASVVVNLTSTEAAGPGFVTAYAGGSSRPPTSSLNVGARNGTVANQATVPVGPRGEIELFASQATHLVVDVAGYYRSASATASGRLQLVVPERVLDTRGESMVGHSGAKPAAGATTDVTVAGRAGVPAGDASAVVVNVTATSSDSAGYITVFPTGSARPMASSLNVNRRGDTVANIVVVPLGADGSISIYTQSGAHLVADVLGYYTGAASPTSRSGLFVAAPPGRIIDTRSSTRLQAGQTTVIDVGAPPGMAAAVANLTLDQPGGPGFLTAFESDTSRPGTSTVNASAAAETVANASTISLGNGKIATFNQMSTELVVDVVGWITA